METNNEYGFEYENEDEQAPAPKKKHTGLIIGIVAAVIIVLAAAAVIVLKVLIPRGKYAEGEALLAAGQYEEAIAVFEGLGDFKDSPYMVNKSQYKYGVELYEDGEFKKAMKVFKALGDFRDSEAKLEACEEALRDRMFTAAMALYDKKKYEEAMIAFKELGNYKDSEKYAKLCSLRLFVGNPRSILSCGDEYTAAVKSNGTAIAIETTNTVSATSQAGPTSWPSRLECITPWA